MHRNKSTILFAIVFYFAFVSVVQADEAIIATDNLNVRTGPGTDFDQIGQVHTGETFPILSQENGWVEIKMEHGSGWITDEFVSIHRDSDENPANRSANNDTVNKSITIQHDNTHLRNGPSTEYEIAGYAEKGEEFDVIAESGDWYNIASEQITGYVFKDFVNHQMTSIATGLENKTIVIDAGHGGRDVGAIGASGTYEKDFTYRTMQELEKELSILGAEVILTREEDRFVPLASRPSLSNLTTADAFISIHYNSFPKASDVTGIGTYYYHEQYEELAKLVQKELVSKTGATDRGVQDEDYYVIRQNFQPSILVELGFISNPEKEQLLKTNSYQKNLVAGIVTGLSQYFNLKNTKEK
ncbi:N-acetylmuramoyl-L-alanine amidase [Lentibacillus halodurans]|uniref:N-acetylmuramoyl-L-alanine amidase n=1 Tax=Lentibacillus halodurans TaxID=237679 RepID=A0A1I0UZJ7_9BACI|nr:N-acetylmuramoyl-L-alanine amidase [Lentibacillus halodurans]SFA69313.1 N-acetylmuramoyl-L-alanine amidase [Lentibacillus halodurans]